jgi:hypothetical protein
MAVGISPFFDLLQASVSFYKAIGGILCSFVGLLFTVTFRFSGNVQWNLQSLLLTAGALAVLRLKVDVFWVVLVGLAISVHLFI